MIHIISAFLTFVNNSLDLLISTAKICLNLTRFEFTETQNFYTNLEQMLDFQVLFTA